MRTLSNPCKKMRFVSHGGDVWGFSRKHNISVEKVLDFSAPINFLGASPRAVEAVKEYAGLIRFYPDPNPIELKTEIAKYVGLDVSAKNIILGNGSIELIYMLPEVFSVGFKALIPVPSFTEYEKAVLRVQGEVVFVQLPEDFRLEVDYVKKKIEEDIRVVFLCNPHSPSGTLCPREVLLDLAEFCNKKGVILGIDENYIEFTKNAEEATLAGYVKKFRNLFIIRSVTKFYGMPGLRFGYGIAAEDLIDELETIRQPWSINGLAGVATLAALKDKEFIGKTQDLMLKERAELVRMLNDIGGLKVFPSVTNFVLVRILGKGISSTALREELNKKGILIRDCSTFVGLDDSFFRVTVRSYYENRCLVEALRVILGSMRE